MVFNQQIGGRMELAQIKEAVESCMRQFGIDNLALEMTITSKIWNLIKEKKDRTEQTKESLALGLTDWDIRTNIKVCLKNVLHMNPYSPDGERFAEFAFLRNKHGEKIEQFAKWWNENGGDPKFWSYKRMESLWFHAFKESERHVTPNPTDKWEQGGFIPAPKEDDK
jgi:hypothetical protein